MGNLLCEIHSEVKERTETMTFLRKMKAVFLFQMRQIFATWKNPVVFLLVGIFVWANVQQVGDFAKIVGLRVHPWLFSHLTNDFVCQLVFTAACVAIFCDAPWNTRLSEYILVRSGKRAQSGGHILYIAILSLVYTLFIFVMSVFAVSFNAEFAGGWGKVLGTLARTNAGIQIGMSFEINDFLIGAYTPFYATALSFILEWACFTWLGLCVYLCNKYIGKMSGFFAATVFVLLDITVANEFNLSAYHFSPITLSQLSALQGMNAQHGITLGYAVCFFAFGISAMVATALFLSRRNVR